MNIYVLELIYHDYPSKYLGHVVIAKTALKARRLCPDRELWTDTEFTSCTKIGVSDSIMEYVVMSAGKC